MKTTAKAIDSLKEKGVKFDAARLELAKKDERGIPQSTGKHLVTILRDERKDDIREYTGQSSFKEVVGIRYWFDENGTEKYYDVPLFMKGTKDQPDYRLAKFSELNEGDKITLEYIRKGERGFIDVKKVGEELPTVNESDEPVTIDRSIPEDF